MKIVIVNKSDSTGGAAVVSRRLMEALREEGADARMLVVEKLSDSPYVIKLERHDIKLKFLFERLKIFLANGLNRGNLFKIDTGEEGLPLWNHPIVKEADAILLNWVNQGMMSLKGFKKILESGKPVVWTMHDMWEMTGICHHAGTCRHFEKECGDCPLLDRKASPKDLSHQVWKRKKDIYNDEILMKRCAFVAVSTWLKERGEKSSLLRNQKVEVIGNAFECEGTNEKVGMSTDESQISNSKCRVLFGAARLDDPIKGLDTLKESVRILKENYPEIAKRIEISLFGGVKNPKTLEGFALPVKMLGVLKGEEEVRQAYKSAKILVSASSYETLPGTLVEAQAYGSIPVSFNQGGQRDIVDHLQTGYIAHYSEDMKERALNLAEGLAWAYGITENPEMFHEMKIRMKQSVEAKFSYSAIARQYLNLIERLQKSI